MSGDRLLESVILKDIQLILIMAGTGFDTINLGLSILLEAFSLLLSPKFQIYIFNCPLDQY